MDQSSAYYEVSRPTLHQRVERFLGFGTCSSPRFEDVSDHDPKWAAGYLESEVTIFLDWKDRLRLIVSGKLMVSTSIKTSAFVERSMAKSNISVLPPFYKVRT